MFEFRRSKKERIIPEEPKVVENKSDCKDSKNDKYAKVRYFDHKSADPENNIPATIAIKEKLIAKVKVFDEYENRIETVFLKNDILNLNKSVFNKQSYMVWEKQEIKQYYISYYKDNEGRSFVGTIEEAKSFADKHASYTSFPITIEVDGRTIAIRHWMDGNTGGNCFPNKNPIRFGDKGFYMDWANY